MGSKQEEGRRPPEAESLVGDIREWEADPDFRFPAQRGMRVVLDLDPDEAALVRQAVPYDGDYVTFVRQAVVEAARAAAGHGATAGLLTIAAAAERFGVPRVRLQRAAMAGRLPAQKVGPGKSHPWLVRPEEVERFLREWHRGRKRTAA